MECSSQVDAGKAHNCCAHTCHTCHLLYMLMGCRHVLLHAADVLACSLQAPNWELRAQEAAVAVDSVENICLQSTHDSL